MTLAPNRGTIDSKGRTCIDVICDICGHRYESGTGSPTLAACHAEVIGWIGRGSKRGMACPACKGADDAS